MAPIAAFVCCVRLAAPGDHTQKRRFCLIEDTGNDLSGSGPQAPSRTCQYQQRLRPDLRGDSTIPSRYVHGDARDVNQDGRREYRRFKLCVYLRDLASATATGLIYFPRVSEVPVAITPQCIA